MTKAEFLEATKANGIRIDAFSLDTQGDECYVLADRDGMWDVYYGERGLETRNRHFLTESAALDYLLELLRADPLTKREAE